MPTQPKKKNSRRRRYKKYNSAIRRRWILVIFLIVIIILFWRAIDLQINSSHFLQSQGQKRHIGIEKIIVHRGMLMDRNGEPLAISTPIQSVWVNPKQFVENKSQWGKLAGLLDIELVALEKLLINRMQREFVYVKRHISPFIAAEVKELKLSGVFLQREYRRYYPTKEMSAHLLGFTNIDDQGQEGLELGLNNFLTGISGVRQVIKNKYGKVIAYVKNISLPRPGQDIRLSIDRRLQYWTYQELKTAVLRAKATAGSAIILDIKTGEVLAMTNQPDYNPNNRRELKSDHYRNRVITDVFEPGSTIKPFTIIAALTSGKYIPTSRIDTRPGILKLGKHIIRDSRNYGVIDLATVIRKSSNVGASKIALSLSAEQLWNNLTKFGFGKISGSGFPGEVAGSLMNFQQWNKARQGTIGYGYGINMTILQLARAYAAIGNQGILPPISFFPTEAVQGQQIIRKEIAAQTMQMLEAVVTNGTGTLAQVKGFRVAGKTGTVRKYITGKYVGENHLALFVGIVPASAPRLVMVVLIDSPHRGSYYGGKIAAPVFSKVMTNVLRVLNISPDDY